jgi:hypothetical protein
MQGRRRRSTTRLRRHEFLALPRQRDRASKNCPAEQRRGRAACNGARRSVAWDAIEPLLPAIDAKVFALIVAREFARSDFPQSDYNVHRLTRDVTQALLHKASLSSREIEDAADWIARAIVCCTGWFHSSRSTRSAIESRSDSPRRSAFIVGRRCTDLTASERV